MASFLADWIPLNEDDTHEFPCLRGRGSTNPDAPVYLGTLLHQALIEVEYVRALLSEHGQEAVAQYLESRGFIGKLSLRVGDLGEVLAGAVICEAESLVLPIQKVPPQSGTAGRVA